MSVVDPNFCDPNDIRELMASWMESHQGRKEIWGRNDGPEIREWLRLVHLLPGNEWCAATVVAAGHYSAATLGIKNPVPTTGGALNLWKLSGKIDATSHKVAPARGRIFVLDHGRGKGHAGIISKVNLDGSLEWYSGNTNIAGSRIGDSLLWKSGDLEKAHHGTLVGFIDPSVLIKKPLVV